MDRLALCVVTLAVLGLAVLGPEAAAAPDRNDIHCKAESSYIGNLIDTESQLVICGPKDRTWEFVTRDRSLALEKKVTQRATGTYELVDGLAVFTGKFTMAEPGGFKTREVRFGLNYAFPGAVEFNRFFPGTDGTLHYRRKWFRQKDGAWQPAEEHILTLACKLPGERAERWPVELKGQVIRWDAAGKKTSETVEKRVVYQEFAPGWYTPAERYPRWVPGGLVPVVVDGQLLYVALNKGLDNALRGFDPFSALNFEP
jgi:hypothetical protein